MTTEERTEIPRLSTESLEVTLNTFVGSAQSGNVAHSMGCVYIILRELVLREKDMVELMATEDNEVAVRADTGQVPSNVLSFPLPDGSDPGQAK